jgi:Xaa-Pro dipeptidase
MALARMEQEQEISNRLKRFQDELALHGVDGALIVQKADLYYLTGTDQDAHLWVPAAGPPLLMVRKSLERAVEDAATRQIVPLRSLSQIPEHIQGNGGARGLARIGLEMDVVPVNRYLIYQRLFPEADLVDVSTTIRETRMIKSPYEISCITAAASMADAMYEQVPQFLKESEREIDLTGRIEAWYRSQGHPGVIPTRSFNHEPIYGQIIAGEAAAMPSNTAGPLGGKGLGRFFSHGASMEAIKPRTPVLIDYAASVEGYIADQTRIFSVGKLDETLVQAHEVALRIQDALCQKGRPGITAEALYDLALEIANAAGLADRFMGYPDPVPFVGHGVGLELDELPVVGRGSSTLLTEGMVIALEPKFVFPGQGVVGIENTFVVTKDGMKKLNRFQDAIKVC